VLLSLFLFPLFVKRVFDYFNRLPPLNTLYPVPPPFVKSFADISVFFPRLAARREENLKDM
ncbi:MAG: hypothetical protein LBI36_01415, partial [Oscillospiraceae bacterium]|jgi:hypothetical protein|nr:hypothetical protein [Oscillospiraceae bacterium]